MDSILRGAAVYFFLLLVLRVAGKRSLAQITVFDFVLLLIISETTQQALLGQDFSIFNAFLLILTLVSIDVFMSLLESRFKSIKGFTEGYPLILVDKGKVLSDRLKSARVDESEILTAARELQGLESMDQVKYAVLERSGGISIIPHDPLRENV